MNFNLSAEQAARQERGTSVGRQTAGVTAVEVIAAAAAAGLLEGSDLLGHVVVLDALAAESASSALGLAVHMACVLSLPDRASLVSGQQIGALTLATEKVPDEGNAVLNGTASWVAPLTDKGVALVGARRGKELVACVVEQSSQGVSVEPIDVAGFRGIVMGHLHLRDAPCMPIGPTQPVMARARTLIAAVGLGIARRAVREALGSARGTSHGAGGEQTAQGLIADAATDLDAAMMLTWKAATAPLSLGLASMAKLAATVAAQRAVERATQVIGAESFREGHVIERLTQDVRALELFAGRTEALRDAVAVEQL